MYIYIYIHILQFSEGRNLDLFLSSYRRYQVPTVHLAEFLGGFFTAGDSSSVETQPDGPLPIALRLPLFGRLSSCTLLAIWGHVT